jgi:UDP-N-acetylglucosamine transferase subunit ALG13
MKTQRDLDQLKFLNGAIVVSAGGHLEQALRRATQLQISNKVIFYTPRNSQSESKLKGFKHEFIRNVRSRDLKEAFLAFLDLYLIFRKREIDYVLSTGAAVAVACFFVCKLRRIDFYYVESIARQDGPSMTGKILQLLRGENLFTESRNFDMKRWRRIDSLFSEYHLFELTESPMKKGGLKIFVTVGTVHQYKFQRMVSLVNSVINDDDEVIWQIGNIDSIMKGGRVHTEMSAEEFSKSILDADVVISHAGVGSVLNTLDAGKSPVLIPRLSSLDEHIDNHQFEIASLVANLGLAVVVTDELNRDILYAVKNRRVAFRDQPQKS